MTERLPFHFSLSRIGEGNGNPLQCSCLENPRDGGAWWAAVYGVAQSQTRLRWLSSSRLKRTYSRAQKHWKLGGLGEPLICQINKTGGGRFWLSSNSKCASWVPIPGLILVYYQHIHEPLFTGLQSWHPDFDVCSDSWQLSWNPDPNNRSKG